MDAELVSYLDGMESRLGKRVENIGARLDTIDQRIDNVESRLNERIDNVESRLNERIDNVESRLNERIDHVESRLNDRIEHVETALLTEFHKWASPLEMRQRSHAAAIRALDTEVEAIADRVKKLENPGGSNVT